MKKKLNITIAGAFVITAVLSGCSLQGEPTADESAVAEDSAEKHEVVESVEAATEESVEAVTKAVEEYEKINNYDSLEMMDGVALTETELKTLQEFFNKEENFAYTVIRYRTPDEINLDRFNADTKRAGIICTKGVKKGNFVQVVISYDTDKRYDRRISLIETNNSDAPYEFYSCRQLWENAMDKIIEAPVYGTKETVTCGVINKYDDYTTEIVIIEDNAVSGKAFLSPFVGAENEASDDIKEIAFCDIDNDGDENMIVVGVYDDETIAILCDKSLANEGGYENNYVAWREGYSMWISENVSDITAENVIKFALNHQENLKTGKDIP